MAHETFRDMIYDMNTPLLAKRPSDRQALESALLRVEANKGRVMAAFQYQKGMKRKSDAKRGADFVAIDGIDRDMHLVLIERVESSSNGIAIIGKDFMRGNGQRPYALRKFLVRGMKSFSVTGHLKPHQAFQRASEAA